MKRRDKIGVAILIGLFCVMGIVLALTVKTTGSQKRGFSDSAIVKQRIINIQKSQ